MRLKTGFMLIRILFFALWLLLNSHTAECGEIILQNDQPAKFDTLYKQIRDGLITKEDAVPKIKLLAEELTEYYRSKGLEKISNSEWVFPLRGYGADAIGGTNGSGYIIADYDFFDGNRHGGHPAHDIFIHDRNQDCIDDVTGEPVDVLSMSGGVVVSLDKEWDTGSDLRGGKYVMVYDPFSNALFYYAHNNAVNVNIGDVVRPGDKIAEVGRSGLNAYKKRSPTHLHISFFLINDGDIIPDNIYKDLLNARRMQ